MRQFKVILDPIGLTDDLKKTLQADLAVPIRCVFCLPFFSGGEFVGVWRVVELWGGVVVVWWGCG